MTDTTTLDAYGVLIEPMTLRLQRMLPGPIERIWSYLTESELRGKWLATGEMELKPGGAFEFVWHNDRLTDHPEDRPAGIEAQHSMRSQVVQVDPPRLLTIAWGERGDVTFELEPRGAEVLLTVTHRRLPDRDTLLKVSAGWHAHLDLLGVRVRGGQSTSFWREWSRLRTDYDARLPH
ncbi:ATPase [Phenylobacterium hankyongense]|uniref:ATPase n=1 Tax=Phenylobacterium hankyongense TaxID=1813876 RepID=A0A328AT59_9CAUL|nr:SRPBCC family protein [Phenylobacterium hankyongense]RAK58312.1 ATPase [Phenylobacterium hankyongense]